MDEFALLFGFSLFTCLLWVYNKWFKGFKPSLLDYVRLLFWFRGKNLEKFMNEHEELFQQAKRTGDHLHCTSHWYDMMAELIASFYGENFHFAPPTYEGQSNEEALRQMHISLARLMQLKPKVKALDLGCGVGGLTRDFARASGAFVTGITASSEEVETANKMNSDLGLGYLCKVVQGDMQALPFADNSFDVVSAVYCLKYLTTLDRVMSEIRRVLKPGGRMLAVCMMKTDNYDPKNIEHVSLYEGFEYSCGMPTMHSEQETIKKATQYELHLISKFNLSHGNLQWHSVFTNNKPLMWVLSSVLVKRILPLLDNTLLPCGFNKFMKCFVCNNVLSIQHAGEIGIMSGSEVLIFEKK